MPESDGRPDYLHFVGAGLEFAGSVLVCVTIGFLIDRQFGFEPEWCSVIGGLLGFLLGMYNFIRLIRNSNQ